MKIRIRTNSIRIRLSKSEIDEFGKTGRLEDHTDFGDAIFSYALVSSEAHSRLSASFRNNTITLYVPVATTSEWTATDRVGYDCNMETTSGKNLYLLIEKDFKCVDAPPQEDQSDFFDHPAKVC